MASKTKHNLILPKPYLSYSAIDLWKRDKTRFRRRYYEGITDPDSAFSLFGREVHALIDSDPKFADIRLAQAEKKVEVEIDGIPVLGYIDTYDPDTPLLGEYKSAIRNPDGTSKWTKSTVLKHNQLPFYSLLVQEKYGVKVNKTYLVWLETAWEEGKKKMGGATIGFGRRLVLTGHTERFERRIYQYDRDRMRKWIVESAKEISDDFTLWKKNK